MELTYASLVDDKQRFNTKEVVRFFGVKVGRVQRQCLGCLPFGLGQGLDAGFHRIDLICRDLEFEFDLFHAPDSEADLPSTGRGGCAMLAAGG